MRVAIVNDVALAVEAMRRVLLSAREHELAWVAHDGAQAVQLCAHDAPDLVLMDIIMPRMDGVEATRLIMARTPCPILVVTANVTDHSSKVFAAMGAGALDAVNTPVLESPGSEKGAHALLTKIETIRRLIGHEDQRREARSPRRYISPAVPSNHRLVAIGASAGGPAALARLLGQFPLDFPAAVVVVQHVDSHFAQALANWLDFQTPLEVRLAQEGDFPQPGTVLMAGHDHHLVFAGPTRLAYAPQPTQTAYCPSVDVFFKSVDRFWRGQVVGVLLTGMGRDGAEALRTLRDHGHHTIAQDQATSAVYGMPKAAADLHAASEILALNKIAPRLARIFANKEPIHA